MERKLIGKEEAHQEKEGSQGRRPFLLSLWPTEGRILPSIGGGKGEVCRCRLGREGGERGLFCLLSVSGPEREGGTETLFYFWGGKTKEKGKILSLHSRQGFFKLTSSRKEEGGKFLCRERMRKKGWSSSNLSASSRQEKKEITPAILLLRKEKKRGPLVREGREG